MICYKGSVYLATSSSQLVRCLRILGNSSSYFHWNCIGNRLVKHQITPPPHTNAQPDTSFHTNLILVSTVDSHLNLIYEREKNNASIKTVVSKARPCGDTYRQVSNIRRTLVGNKIVDHSDRRCSNYIFILNLTPGFNGLGKDKYKVRREAFKFWDLVRLILETLQ